MRELRYRDPASQHEQVCGLRPVRLRGGVGVTWQPSRGEHILLALLGLAMLVVMAAGVWMRTGVTP